jgi:hypothetical protein
VHPIHSKCLKEEDDVEGVKLKMRKKKKEDQTASPLGLAISQNSGKLSPFIPLPLVERLQTFAYRLILIYCPASNSRKEKITSYLGTLYSSRHL